MSETSKKIIEEIRERKITHIPKWYFLLKNIVVWFLLVLAAGFGALSVSIEESILERGIGVHGFLSSEFFGMLFRGISMLWILCTILFVVLAFLNLRLTNEGYRYRTWWIVLGILLVLATFVLLFHREGIGDRAEAAIEHSHFYPAAPHS